MPSHSVREVYSLNLKDQEVISPSAEGGGPGDRQKKEEKISIEKRNIGDAETAAIIVSLGGERESQREKGLGGGAPSWRKGGRKAV